MLREFLFLKNYNLSLQWNQYTQQTISFGQHSRVSISFQIFLGITKPTYILRNCSDQITSLATNLYSTSRIVFIFMDMYQKNIAQKKTVFNPSITLSKKNVQNKMDAKFYSCKVLLYNGNRKFKVSILKHLIGSVLCLLDIQSEFIICDDR